MWSKYLWNEFMEGRLSQPGPRPKPLSQNRHAGVTSSCGFNLPLFRENVPQMMHILNCTLATPNVKRACVCVCVCVCVAPMAHLQRHFGTWSLLESMTDFPGHLPGYLSSDSCPIMPCGLSSRACDALR